MRFFVFVALVTVAVTMTFTIAIFRVALVPEITNRNLSVTSPTSNESSLSLSILLRYTYQNLGKSSSFFFSISSAFRFLSFWNPSSTALETFSKISLRSF